MNALDADDHLPQDTGSSHDSEAYAQAWDDTGDMPGLALQALSPRAAQTPRNVPQSPRVWTENGQLNNGLHRRQSPGVHNRPHLAFELRPLRMSNDVELLKPDGELSEDEDITLRRTIAALVLNLRGIDPDLRESGLDMLCGLAARRDCKDKIREVAGEALQRLVKFLGPMYAAQGESLRSKAAAALGNLATDSDVNAQAIAQLGGIDALLAVAGEDTEPILAAAAMQALTGLVGSADAKAMLLQHPGFLDTLLNSVSTDGKQPDARLESHLWLLSALVQSSREAQTAALRCLPDLTQLLDTGPATSLAAAAAAALSSLVAQNEHAQTAAQNVGALEKLLRLLHLATPETGDIMHQPPAVERAAWALAELCAGNAANKAAVLELHGIAPLVWLLDGPADSMATTGAAAALCNLAEGSADLQAAICQAGALDRFPALLQGGLASGGLIVEAIAWCIQHLAESSPEARDTLRENGTLPLLCSVLKGSAEASARERAAWAICNTATKNEKNRTAYRKLGALPQLVHILSSGEESGLAAAALWALLQLAADDPANQRAMATLGVVPHLVRLLESANEVIAEGASECLLHIVAPAEGHPAVHPSQLALRSAGAIPSLLSVVEANPEKPAAVTAVGTLQNLAAESSANKEAIRDAGGIAVLVSLIKDWPDTLAANVAVEALANLMAGSSPGREAVRAAGGVPVLVRLLDAGPWKDVTERATAAIAELVHTCPENQSLVVEEGGAAKLMALLKAGPNHPVTPHAARALQSLACRHPGAQASILKEQAVPALVKVLDGGPVSAGTAASVWALMEICMRNPAGQQQLLEHDGLTKIVGLLSSGPHMAITAAAAWALYAATQGNRPAALAAFHSGALQPLLELVQGGGSQAALEGALSTLANMAAQSAEAQQAALDSGLPDVLVKCLQQAINGKSTLRMAELAALALRALAAGSAPAQDAARAAGAPPLLAALLSPAQNRHMAEERKARKENAASAAAQAVLALADGNSASKDAFVRAGAVAELVAAMVRSPERQLAVHAAAALLALIDGHTDAQLALQELGGIQVLVNMLASQASPPQLQEPLTAVLCSLASSFPDSCMLMLQAGLAKCAASLLGALSSDELKSQVAQLIQHIAQRLPQAQGAFQDAGAVPALLQLLQLGPDHSTAGAAARALLVLLYDFHRAPAWL